MFASVAKWQSFLQGAAGSADDRNGAVTEAEENMTELDSSAVPEWLTVIAWLSLAVAFGCAIWITIDLARRPQQMRVMNLVWPIVALFGSALWLWLYLRHGRASLRSSRADSMHEHTSNARPGWVPIAVGTSHCGAGCALGDLVAEIAVLLLPALATAVGWQHLYEQRIFAGWIWALVAAYAFGIAFQYAAIAPMRRQSRWRSLIDALKADTASIAAWQLGMYGAMAVFQFAIFRPWLDGTLRADTAAFWLAMQLAMLAGFACSYPVNALLIKSGVKEAM